MLEAKAFWEHTCIAGGLFVCGYKEKVSEAAYLAGSKTCGSYSNSLYVKLFPVFESIFAFRNNVFSSISLYYFQFSKFQVSLGYHEWVLMCPFDSGLEIYKKYDTPLYFTKIQPFSVSYEKYYYYLIQLIHNISSQICQSYHFNIFFSNITFYQAQLLKFISNYQSILFINIISRLKTTHSIPEFS